MTTGSAFTHNQKGDDLGPSPSCYELYKPSTELHSGTEPPASSSLRTALHTGTQGLFGYHRASDRDGTIKAPLLEVLWMMKCAHNACLLHLHKHPQKPGIASILPSKPTKIRSSNKLPEGALARIWGRAGGVIFN